MKQTTLTKRAEAGSKWYPIYIDNLVGLIGKVVDYGMGFSNVYALRHNIAYNLQHLEFLDRCIEDIKLTEALTKQIYKNFVVIGCSIIESLLTFLLIRSGNYKETEWELVCKVTGQEQDIDGVRKRIDCHIYKKLDTKKREEMDFDAMLKKAESKKLLGSEHKIYSDLKYLRKLRNKVHLQAIKEPTDTDWNAFEYRHLCAMALVIHSVFTGPIFRPKPQEKKYFEYLVKHAQQRLEPLNSF